ncbi:hypothetical protein PUNSTDRAFT_139664 [Punctularia strigosozonata HHB-11173 SS5]|uniref:Uncharacterized protein n=1 Tax=Punctularia strigosozonata (strain HHB-11173) TaxID=741275 RepID=R7S0J0_PUNST|nr:uncharacterized protein PUNSTDRAFT_139664 [Punctularia strigosozonata HHB-11173 SS5]EIN03317.1 hypothetical protein PUNSTDRAFT_139664 [Punctularia strigosozonata HHB-11173 SS5]
MGLTTDNGLSENRERAGPERHRWREKPPQDAPHVLATRLPVMEECDSRSYLSATPPPRRPTTDTDTDTDTDNLLDNIATPSNSQLARTQSRGNSLDLDYDECQRVQACIDAAIRPGQGTPHARSDSPDLAAVTDHQQFLLSLGDPYHARLFTRPLRGGEWTPLEDSIAHLPTGMRRLLGTYGTFEVTLTTSDNRRTRVLVTLAHPRTAPEHTPSPDLARLHQEPTDIDHRHELDLPHEASSGRIDSREHLQAPGPSDNSDPLHLSSSPLDLPHAHRGRIVELDDAGEYIGSTQTLSDSNISRHPARPLLHRTIAGRSPPAGASILEPTISTTTSDTSEPPPVEAYHERHPDSRTEEMPATPRSRLCERGRSSPVRTVAESSRTSVIYDVSLKIQSLGMCRAKIRSRSQRDRWVETPNLVRSTQDPGRLAEHLNAAALFLEEVHPPDGSDAVLYIIVAPSPYANEPDDSPADGSGTNTPDRLQDVPPEDPRRWPPSFRRSDQMPHSPCERDTGLPPDGPSEDIRSTEDAITRYTRYLISRTPQANPSDVPFLQHVRYRSAEIGSRPFATRPNGDEASTSRNLTHHPDNTADDSRRQDTHFDSRTRALRRTIGEHTPTLDEKGRPHSKARLWNRRLSSSLCYPTAFLGNPYDSLTEPAVQALTTSIKAQSIKLHASLESAPYVSCATQDSDDEPHARCVPVSASRNDFSTGFFALDDSLATAHTRLQRDSQRTARYRTQGQYDVRYSYPPL